MSKDYDASAIEVLTGLDPVRKRPGMYTNTLNPNHIAQEVVDNSVDEALAGFADFIKVILFLDGSMRVEDNGRGMPVDEHPEQKKSGVEVILTTLHAGGKFSDSNYQFSGGLHGVGVSVVNALSSNLRVQIKRGGELHSMDFINGAPLDALRVIDKVGQKNTGTMVHFYPDEKFFETAKFDIKGLKKFLRAKAVLCAGLKIELEIETSADMETEKVTWQYAGGLAEYLQMSLNDEVCVPQQVIVMNSQEDEGEVDLALCWLLEFGESITESYVNAIPTLQGGTHVNGLRTGLTEAVREFLDIHNLLPRGVKITGDDVCKNLTYVLSIKMKDPQFLGQTKERLSSREAAGRVSQTVKDNFSLWLNQHMDVSRKICEAIIDNARTRQQSSKKAVRKKIASGPALPGKLTDCISQDIEQTELFLVEGDSAGGSARQARDKSFQAVMPLRGKILNTWEVSHQQVLASEEIHDISVALGIDPNSYSVENLRYGKICILADADSDGLHIATLLCALFLRHFRVLVEKGHIYIAMPPLYRIDMGKETRYAIDAEERDHIINNYKGNAKVQITRFKGLGEMNPIQLRESTLHPDTRRLLQLTVDAESNSMDMMDQLLGKKRIVDRKAWLEKKGDLADVG
jgi:topoisomerase-4 subunit B